MKWNDEEGYVAYQSAFRSIKSLLGITNIDFSMRCELAPYITYILSYVNKRLVFLGENVDMKTKLDEVFEIFEHGETKIVREATLDLVRELGIDTGDIYVDNEEIPYNQDRFVYTWGNLMTALVVRLKFQYAHLMYQKPINTECPCNNGCPPGNSTKDYENWTSGVYPEDEAHSYTPNDNFTSWRTNADYPECTKCYRE